MKSVIILILSFVSATMAVCIPFAPAYPGHSGWDCNPNEVLRKGYDNPCSLHTNLLNTPPDSRTCILECKCKPKYCRDKCGRCIPVDRAIKEHIMRKGLPKYGTH